VSAAAPTAGLHLTEPLLDRCRARGVEVATIELAVGLDTFRPVTETRVEDHTMHSESYIVPVSTMSACRAASRVVAIGTTVVRALESAAARDELDGRTDLFITRGFEFHVVDVLLTNFHVPRTTLLALIDAFVGPRWRDLYATALADGYRFLSFGDAMLVERAA
jgi:S-adenosylmethionine:tRNA ribosyltransferase-isomerase